MRDNGAITDSGFAHGRIIALAVRFKLFAMQTILGADASPTRMFPQLGPAGNFAVIKVEQ